jgi:tripartite-type tricarboxylate transporter receptor subunit TctC
MAPKCRRRDTRDRCNAVFVFVLLVAAFAIVPSAFRSVALAQSKPTRPITLVVGFSAGSGTLDAIARIMREWLTRKWMQPVIVENIPGLTGSVGAEAVFRAPPDGRTLLITPPVSLTVARHLQQLAFDPDQFVPVSLLVTTPIVLVVRRDLPAANLGELVAYAREHPGKLKAANQGIGSTSHLTAEWFRLAAVLDIGHVPFRGSAAALQGLSDGRVDLMFDNLGSSREAIASGQVKVLAVASQAREPAMPDVEAVAELLPGFVSSTWIAAVAPPKTPRQITDRLSADFVEGVTQADVAARFRQNSCEPAGMTPEATATFVQAETEKWTKVVRTDGFKLE